MKNRRILSIVLLMLISLLVLQAYTSYTEYQYKAAVKHVFANAQKLEEYKLDRLNSYVKENLYGAIRIYNVLGSSGEVLGKAVISREQGYGGYVYVAVGINEADKAVAGIKIIKHTETPEYGGYITENWFIDRFKNKAADSLFRLTVLEEETNKDIVQVTGATLSSRAVVEAVNSAVIAFNYIETGSMLQKPVVDIAGEKNSETENFFITDENGKKIQINMASLNNYPNEKVDCTLQKSTGTEINMTAEGPDLRNVLKEYGINLDNYKAIGIKGRDGYYALVSKEILDSRQIILGHRFNNKMIIEEEKPIRVVIPGEFGVYWVKMVSDIELYKDISEKNIKSVKIFNELAKGIKPYMYEYYGKKDKSIEVGQILAKLNNVDPKGFFTMTSSDGLVKNETIAMVKSRYYIKTEGEGAPMNVSPNFKLGYNVKNIAYFSTTEDAVIFPEEMAKLTSKASVNGKEGMPIEEVLIKTGMKSGKSYVLRNTYGDEMNLEGSEIKNSVLVYENDSVTAVCETSNGAMELKNLLEINKVE